MHKLPRHNIIRVFEGFAVYQNYSFFIKYKPTTEMELNISRFINIIKYGPVYELCSCCNTEVKLYAAFESQNCPNCGERILPCALCDCDVVDCTKCPLEKENV